MISAGVDLSLWVAFSAGLLSFFSPCVLPLFPSYLTYISGVSFGELREAHPGAEVRKSVLLHSLFFILGFSIIFTALGALAGIASAAAQEHMREGLGWVQRVGGAFIFLFGIHLSGLFHFGVLLGEKRVHLQRKPAGVLGTTLVGVAFAAGWTPCIGPILGAILALAAGISGGVGKGTLLLGAYSAGLAIPFLVSGFLFNYFMEYLSRFRKYIRGTEILTGAMLMGVGGLLFFDLFGEISSLLYRWLPVTG